MRFSLLDHWSIDGNELSISLMRYYVEITIYAEDNKENVLLRVVDNNQKELFFDFKTLEEAITFTEDTINKCDNIEYIMDMYDELYNNEKTLVKRKDYK